MWHSAEQVKLNGLQIRNVKSSKQRTVLLLSLKSPSLPQKTISIKHTFFLFKCLFYSYGFAFYSHPLFKLYVLCPYSLLVLLHASLLIFAHHIRLIPPVGSCLFFFQLVKIRQKVKSKILWAAKLYGNLRLAVKKLKDLF